MKVKINTEYKRQYEEFEKIPYEKRKNIIAFTCDDFIVDKVYDVVAINKNGWYRIVDESGEDFVYPPAMFDIVEG